MRSFLNLLRPKTARQPNPPQTESQTPVSPPQSDESNEKLTQVSTVVTQPVVTAKNEGFKVPTVDSLIPLDSTWKRKPPGKQVVNVKRIWFVTPPGENDFEPGWNVRAQSPKGGRPVVGHFQWFLDNFERVDELR